MLHVLRACMLNLLRVYFFADRERKVVIYYNLLPPPPLSLSLYIYIYISPLRSVQCYSQYYHQSRVR